MSAKQKQLYASVTQNKFIDETSVVARPESIKKYDYKSYITIYRWSIKDYLM
jgi:hypothetical protein